MRGYAPTAVPADGAYQLGALVADAVALHQVLGGDGDAVLIGHDWGAEAAYGAAAYAPDRWRRLVTLAVPPQALDPVLFTDYEQLKRFFYLFMFQDPLGFAEAMVARDGMSFLDKLWLDWSPGYQPGDHLAQIKECLRSPPTWPPPSATTAQRGSRTRRAQPPGLPGLRPRGMRRNSRRPAFRRPSPPFTCTAPPTAASEWSWPAAPNASSPRPHAWS